MEPVDPPTGEGPRRLGPRYWRVWTANASSNFGDGLLLVTLPLLAVSVTDDARLIGLVAAARALPLLFIGPFAGVLADRVDRKRLMVQIDVLRAAVVALLVVLVVTDSLSIWSLIVAGAVLGVAEVPFDITAPAIVRNVVDPDQLEDANANVHNAQRVANNFLGGPIGGFLYAVAPWLALTAVGTTYAGASATMTTVDGDFRPPPTDHVNVRQQLFEGHKFLWNHELFRPQALSVCALAFSGGMTNAVFVLYVTTNLGLGPIGFGLLGVVSAVAAVVMGTLVSRVIRKVGHGNTMALGVTAMACGFTIIGSTDTVIIAAAGLAMLSIGDPLWNIVSMSARQRIVPDEIFGRVGAAYLHIAWSLISLGAVVGGFIAEAYGADRVYLVGVIFQVGVLTLGRNFFPRMTKAMAASPDGH